MRNCFFYYIYFLCKLQYNFHVIHFFVKITNHCLVLFVIFHIKHQSFPLRALSSSGYSQSASLRSSIPTNCSAVYQKKLIFYPYQKLIIVMQYCYFTFHFWYDRMCSVKKNNKVTLQLICWETFIINHHQTVSYTDIFDILSYTHQRQRKR